MDTIRQKIVDIFANNSIDVLSVDENKSLIESGIVDSMTFVNILLEIEESLNIEIDFEKVDFISIVSLKGLYSHIVAL